MTNLLSDGSKLIIHIRGGKSYKVDLNKLKKYSKYYARGFDGRFIEHTESHLIEIPHATSQTVPKTLSILDYLEKKDNADLDQDSEFPLDGSEGWIGLFEIWLFADFLLAPRVMELIMEEIELKGLNRTTIEDDLDVQAIRSYWASTHPQAHAELREAIVSLVATSQAFDSKESADRLLNALPSDFQREMLHQWRNKLNMVHEQVQAASQELKEPGYWDNWSVPEAVSLVCSIPKFDLARWVFKPKV